MANEHIALKQPNELPNGVSPDSGPRTIHYEDHEEELELELDSDNILHIYKDDVKDKAQIRVDEVVQTYKDLGYEEVEVQDDTEEADAEDSEDEDSEAPEEGLATLDPDDVEDMEYDTLQQYASDYHLGEGISGNSSKSDIKAALHEKLAEYEGE